MAAGTSAVAGNTTILINSKKGRLKADSDGYYPMLLGGFNLTTRSGIRYEAGGAMRELAPGSPLQRRIERKQLWGENGHPRAYGMSLTEHLQRLRDLVEERYCIHHKKPAIQQQSTKDEFGNNVILLYGAVKPDGELKQVALSEYEDLNMNPAVSVRTISKQSFGIGYISRDVKELVTWDHVGENGVDGCSKMEQAGCESYSEGGIYMGDDEPFTVLTPLMLEALELQERMRIRDGVESNGTRPVSMLRTALGWERAEILNIPSMSWTK